MTLLAFLPASGHTGTPGGALVRHGIGHDRRRLQPLRERFVKAGRAIRSPLVRADLSMPGPLVPADRGASERSQWLDEFHACSKAAMTELFVDHFASVARSVGQVLGGADKETAIHEVFCRILSDAPMRASFRGGSLRAWLSTIARNHAIDYRRRQRRERPSGTAEDVHEGEAQEATSFETSMEARDLVARFRDE